MSGRKPQANTSSKTPDLSPINLLGPLPLKTLEEWEKRQKTRADETLAVSQAPEPPVSRVWR